MLNPALPSPDPRADADLVLASQSGDQDAFTLIVARYQNLIGASLLAWKTAISEASSPQVRRSLARWGWMSVACLALTLAASWFFLPHLAGRHPALMGVAVGLLLLGNSAVVIWVGNRLRMAMFEETGITAGTAPSALPPSTQLTRAEANQKTLRLTLPCILMLAVGAWGLPWSQYPTRSVAILLLELAVLAWAAVQLRRQFLPTSQNAVCAVPSPELPRSDFRPTALALVLGGTALLAAMIPLFLHPVGPRQSPKVASRLGALALGILGGTAALWMLARALSGNAHPQTSQKMIVDRIYAPFLSVCDGSQSWGTDLKALVLKRTQAATRATLAWIQAKSDPEPWLEEARRCDTQIHRLLDAETEAAFRRFERSLPDRERIERFREPPPNQPRQLSSSQEQQLLETLTETRAQFPWSNPISRRASAVIDPRTVLETKTLDAYERDELGWIETCRPWIEPVAGATLAADFSQFLVQDLQTRMTQWRQLADQTK